MLGDAGKPLEIKGYFPLSRLPETVPSPALLRSLTAQDGPIADGE